MARQTMYLIGRVRRLSFKSKALLVETLALLALARTAVLFLPFRWLVSILGKRGSGRPSRPNRARAQRIRRIGRMVDRASRHVPWTSKCLDQALAAKVLLARRGIQATVYFGVKNDEHGELAAHAWLRSGAIYVTGGRQHAGYSVINIFTDEGA